MQYETALLIGDLEGAESALARIRALVRSRRAILNERKIAATAIPDDISGLDALE